MNAYQAQMIALLGRIAAALESSNVAMGRHIELVSECWRDSREHNRTHAALDAANAELNAAMSGALNEIIKRNEAEKTEAMTSDLLKRFAKEPSND